MNESGNLTVSDVMKLSRKALKEISYEKFIDLDSDRVETIRFNLSDIDDTKKLKIFNKKINKLTASVTELNVGKPQPDGSEYISPTDMRSKIEDEARVVQGDGFKLDLETYGIILNKLNLGYRKKGNGGFILTLTNTPSKFLCTNERTGTVGFNFKEFDNFKDIYLEDIINLAPKVDVFREKAKKKEEARKKEADKELADFLSAPIRGDNDE